MNSNTGVATPRDTITMLMPLSSVPCCCSLADVVSVFAVVVLFGLTVTVVAVAVTGVAVGVTGVGVSVGVGSTGGT